MELAPTIKRITCGSISKSWSAHTFRHLAPFHRIPQQNTPCRRDVSSLICASTGYPSHGSPAGMAELEFGIETWFRDAQGFRLERDPPIPSPPGGPNYSF